MYCNEYRKHVPHINNNYDFSELAGELLGELNVSHTGLRYARPKNIHEMQQRNWVYLLIMALQEPV